MRRCLDVFLRVCTKNGPGTRSISIYILHALIGNLGENLVAYRGPHLRVSTMPQRGGDLGADEHAHFSLEL